MMTPNAYTILARRTPRAVATGSTASELLPETIRSQFEDNPVTAAMVRRDFCMRDDCIDEYTEVAGQVAGGAAGAAACAATGVGAVGAQLCSALGAWLGGVLGDLLGEAIETAIDKLGKARGMTLEEQELRRYREFEEVWKAAPERIFAVLAYLAERQGAIGRVVHVTGAETADVEAIFARLGAPGLEQMTVFFGWETPPPGDLLDESRDAGGFTPWERRVRTLFETYGLTDGAKLLEPPKDDPGSNRPGAYWAEWKIAENLFGGAQHAVFEGVTVGELRQATILVTYPGGVPAIGRDPNAIEIARQAQLRLREIMAQAEADARRGTYIDLSGAPEPGREIPRLRSVPEAFRWLRPRKKGKSSAGMAVALGGLGLAAILALA